jgi:hypothetical protein
VGDKHTTHNTGKYVNGDLLISMDWIREYTLNVSHNCKDNFAVIKYLPFGAFVPKIGHFT